MNPCAAAGLPERAGYSPQGLAPAIVQDHGSGRAQAMRRAELDRDGDAFLIHADREGSACHGELRSCLQHATDPEGRAAVAGKQLRPPREICGEGGQGDR